MAINWYPGHMAKTKRLLIDQVGRVDLVIELCDARLPFSSRNPDLEQVIGKKNRVLLLNKADLSDPLLNEQWLRYFRKNGMNTFLSDMGKFKVKEMISIIENATRETVEKAARKGFNKTVRVMVAGVPNVGKSSFINRLRGGSIAETGDRPGVTKNTRWIHITSHLEIMDTPGLLWPRLDDQNAARKLCYIGSIKDDIIDVTELSLHLLDDIIQIKPESITERYHVKDTSLRGIQLMDEVCKGRGFMLKAGQYDYERCANIVLDEFRAGKLGRITLESPN
jgi:ribosome biogenesis GTPase A